MSWENYRLEELFAEPSRNGVYKPKDFQGAGTPLVKMNEAFANRRLQVGDYQLDRLQLTSDELERFRLEEDDLIFTRTSVVPDGVGLCSIISKLEYDTAFESNLIRVRIDRKKADPKYIFYFFQSPKARGRILAIANGVAVRTIRGSDLRSIQIGLPDRTTQEKYANVLSAYDDLIENNRRRIQLLEQAARLLYKEWFAHLRFPGHEHTPVIDGVPNGWEKKKLGDVAATNAESFKTKNLPNEVNYIDISSVKQGRILSKNKMPSSEAPGRARRKGADGDVIWSNVRPNLRAYALVLEPDENDVFSTGFTILSPAAIPFSYLYLFATTDEFVGHLVNHTTGASYPAVRPDDFEKAEILLPTQSVLKIFHEKMAPAFRMIQVLEKDINALAKARDLLLPKLMNGELAV